ncbi:MAG: hypothetical protein WC055_09575 [Melioribacteraceae bacterium]
MRHVPRHLTLEVSLAVKLVSKGNKCVFVSCSSILPICNAWDIRDLNTRETCNYCSNNNVYFSENFPFNMIFLGNYVTSMEVDSIKNKYNNLKIDDLKSFRVNDIDLGDELYLSLAKFLFRGNVPETPINLKYARDFAISGEIIVTGLLRVFEKEKPEVVILNSGHIFWFGIAYKILKKFNIKTVSYDETNIAVTKLTWTFDDTNPCVDYNWTNHWEREKEKKLETKEFEKINELIETRKKYFLYQQNTDTIPLLQRCDISRYNTKVALFTNVLWDATVVGKNPIFESMMDWISHTIDIFNGNHDLCLVIRVHPAEAGVYGMISKERVRLELQNRGIVFRENIFFVDAEENVNSYDIIDKCDVVLSYASNIGLEAVLDGKPVIVVGAPHYKNRGFTLDPKSISEYDTLLEKVLKGDTLILPKVELARKYAKLAFIDTQIDLKIFKDKHPHKINNININSFADISDELKTVSLICDWITKTDLSGYYIQDWGSNYK